MPDLKRVIREIHRRSLWQVLGIYAASGWVVLGAVGVSWSTRRTRILNSSLL